MKKIAIFAAMLVVFPSISLAFDPNDAWHPLSQIVKSSTNLVSVDANNDGIIDSAAFASAAGAAASVPWSGISGKPDYVSSLDQYVNTNSDVTHSILRVGQLCIGDDCKTAWPTTSSMSWSAITGKPTTVSGYGITDMALQSVNYASSAGGANSVPWSGITGNPFSYSGGNVGIGTTGPTAPLKVVGSNNPDGYSQILQVADSSDATKLVFVGYDSSNDYGILGAVDTGITFKALKIGPGNTYFTGNVGIGTASPSNKLSIYGTSGHLLNLSNDTTSMGFYIGGLSGGVGGASLGTITNHGLRLFTNNTDKVTILANGNVGIGTTSPGALLDLYKPSPSTSNFVLSGSGMNHGMTSLAPTNAASYMGIRNSGGGGVSFRGFSSSDGNYLPLEIEGIFGTTDPNDSVAAIYLRGAKKLTTGFQALDSAETVLKIQNIGTDLITVLGSGNLGIGTTGPGVALDVNGTIRTRTGVFQLNDGTTTGGGLYFHKAITGSGSSLEPALFAEGTGKLHFMTGGSATTKMLIDQNGNVGIGTTSPGEKLDVQGNIEFGTGNIKLTYKSGSNPGCNKIVIARNWNQKSCSSCSSCQTSAGWSSSTPTCTYYTNWDAECPCCYGAATCTADTWTEAICFD
jgi:hypothetical protein